MIWSPILYGYKINIFLNLRVNFSVNCMYLLLIFCCILFKFLLASSFCMVIKYIFCAFFGQLNQAIYDLCPIEYKKKKRLVEYVCILYTITFYSKEQCLNCEMNNLRQCLLKQDIEPACDILHCGNIVDLQLWWPSYVNV